MGIDFLGDAPDSLGHGRLDGLYSGDKERKCIAIAEDGPPSSGLLERLEDHLPGDLVAVPGMARELVELGQVIEHAGARSSNHRHSATAPVGRSNVDGKLDTTPQRRSRRDSQANPVGLLGQDELRRTTLNHLDLVVAPSEGRTSSGAEIVDHLALGEDPQDVRIKVGQVDGGARYLLGPPPLALKNGGRLPSLQAQDPALGTALLARHDLAATPQLLEGEDPDRFFSERTLVARLGRLKEVASHFPQPVGAHTPAVIVDSDYGEATFSPQHHPYPLPPALRLRVFVGGIGDELVQRVFGVQVGLAAHEDGLGQVPNSQADLLCRHES